MSAFTPILSQPITIVFHFFAEAIDDVAQMSFDISLTIEKAFQRNACVALREVAVGRARGIGFGHPSNSVDFFFRCAALAIGQHGGWPVDSL